MDKRYPLILILVLFVFSFSLSGFTWHRCCIDTVLGSGAYGTDIEVDSLGYPHIIYKEIYDKGLMYVRWDGSGWLYEDISESLTVKGREKGTSGMISLELDSLGYPHISTCGPGYYYKDGTGWHLETGMDPGSHDNDYTSLRLDSLDYPHIAYNDKYYVGPDEYTGVRYCWKDGGGWNVNVVVIPDPEVVSVGEYGVFLALDSLDLPHIIYSWGDDTNQFVRTMGYAYKDISSIWHKELFDSSTVWGHYVNLELDSLDRPMVAYGFGGGTTKLRFAWRDAGAWNTEWVDTVGYAGIADGFTLDSLDNSFIVYWANCWLKIAWSEGTGWQTEKIDSITSGSALVTSYGIAIDRYGYIHISYSRSLGGMDQNRMWYATTHPTVGIREEIEISEEILLVPDFAVGNFLSIEWNTLAEVDIGLYDIIGRKVKMIYTGLGRRSIKTDMDSLASGIYFIVLKSPEGKEVKKITILR